MGEYVIKLPDIGEGVAEAELVEWLVELGQAVKEDDALAAFMTDKATVEIPSPVIGTVSWLGAGIGETIAVGSPIIRLEVDGAGNVRGSAPDESVLAREESCVVAESTEPAKPVQAKVPVKTASKSVAPPVRPALPRPRGEKIIAPPSVRAEAREAGIDLKRVLGTGPAGRISHDDLEAFIASGSSVSTTMGRVRNDSTEDIKVIGLRRKIAEKMSIAKSRIPHITYIEEIDVTALEDLRTKLNSERIDGRPKLTVLPFLMRAMARAIAEMPQMNACFDDEAGIVQRFGGVHIGIATQTDNGLIVPVVRHVESLGLWSCASEAIRVSQAARDGSATRDELSGSTITITSLGALGGIATTPVINHPEVSIIGVNKMRVVPVWDGNQFQPRKVMNLSSSFDHRIIDGWDAAMFVQRIKTLLEAPAMIFIED